MIVRCPSCAFQGNIRLPDHVPVGRLVRIRCARCRTPFALNVGRLFPQEQEQGYAALAPESRPCRGERLGNLWVETVGTPAGRTPLVALPAHPAFSHEILHDLLDRFGEYFQVCYVEFPGSSRNPGEAENLDYAAWLSDSLPAIRQRLGAARVHLLAHLASAPMALRAAAESPDEIASLTLLEPDLCLGRRLCRLPPEGELAALRQGQLQDADREALTLTLLARVWRVPLEEVHQKGLARILGAGLSPQLLARDLRECRVPSYRALSRLKVPVLLFSARDTEDPADSLYLQATVPAVEAAVLEKGGALAGWFGGTYFSGKLQAFKRATDPSGSASPPVRRKAQTLNGQPAGWLLLLYALLAGGLTAALSPLAFQPAWVQQLLPQLLAGLLPMLWLLVPRRLPPLRFLRFRGLSLRTTLVPLIAGGLLGAAFRLLLVSVPALTRGELAAALPASLVGPAVGEPGRFAVFVAAGAAALLAYGAAANILALRRSRWALWLPALVFGLVPASWPDLLWRLPAALLAGVLLLRSLSVFGPLSLIAGVGVGAELAALWSSPALQPLQGGPALPVAAGCAAAAVALGLLLGGRGRPLPAAGRYFAGTLVQRPLRWEAALGIVLVVFSTIAAVAAVFLFLQQ